MNRKTEYTDERLGRLKVVPDFLPPPEDLIFKEEDTVKVTMTLTKTSLDFFKDEAAKHNTGYQKMIRRLLDFYARQHR